MKFYCNLFPELMEKLKSSNVSFTDQGSFTVRLPDLSWSL